MDGGVPDVRSLAGSAGEGARVRRLLAYGYGDYEWCERYSEESLELSRQLGDTPRVAWAEFGLGVAAMSSADHESATPHLQDHYAPSRDRDDSAWPGLPSV
jgi:hypothetical protein